MTATVMGQQRFQSDEMTCNFSLKLYKSSIPSQNPVSSSGPQSGVGTLNFVCYIDPSSSVYLKKNTVEPRYLELAYFELPLISKWKSGPWFNMKLWQQVTK